MLDKPGKQGPNGLPLRSLILTSARSILCSYDSSNLQEKQTAVLGNVYIGERHRIEQMRTEKKNINKRSGQPELQILRHKSKAGNGYILFPPKLGWTAISQKQARRTGRETILQFAN